MPDLFAEYGGEEYRPKKKRPAIIDPRKPWLWICAATVIIAIILILWAPWTSSPANSPEAQRQLDRCLQALEEARNMDAFHILRTTEYLGEKYMESRNSSEIWCCGEDVLHVNEYPNVNGGSTLYILKKDGAQYTRMTGNSGEDGKPYDTLWGKDNLNMVVTIDVDGATPFPDLDRDRYQFEFQKAETMDAVETVIFKATSLSMHNYYGGSLTIGFSFYQEELVSVSIFSMEEQQVAELYDQGNPDIHLNYNVTSTVIRLIPDDPAQIRDVIGQAYLQVMEESAPFME